MDEISAQLRLVLEEARATLAQQHEDLSALRSRSSAMLNFAGLAAALLGGLALREGQPLRGWTYASAAAFGIVVMAMVYINLPRKFTFSNDAVKMLNEWRLPDRSADDTAEHLSRFLAQHVVENQPRLERFASAYVVGLAAFVLQVTFLFMALLT